MAIITVPGVSNSISISIRRGLSIPLLLSPEPMSIVSIGTVVMSIAVMPQSMAIIAIPRVSISISISIRSGLSVPLLLSPEPVSIVSIRTVSIVAMSIAIMSQSMAIICVPGVSISISIRISISISIRSGLSVPFLLSPESISMSIVSIGTVVSIAIMSQSIYVPGVSISIRSWLSIRSSCCQGKESPDQKSKLHVSERSQCRDSPCTLR